MQLASPRPAWSWSPLGSIAGSGSGLDPTTVWDAAADPVVAGIIGRGEVDQVNALLRTWTKNAQPLRRLVERFLTPVVDSVRNRIE